MSTTTQLPRGRKPGCLSHLADVQLDLACRLDDDREHDLHTLSDFDLALRDGVIDAREAAHIRAHLERDHALTEASFTQAREANLRLQDVEGLIAGLRTR